MDEFGDFDELVMNTVNANIGGLYLLLSGKAGAEERFLEAKHGAPYRAWAARVRRFVPRTDLFG